MNYQQISLVLIGVLSMSRELESSDRNVRISCCYWATGEFRLNLLPDRESCEQFYHCETTMGSDGQISVKPTRKECPLGLGGQLQFYDFRECKCLEPSQATCFDDSNQEHLDEFFNCTTEFHEEGIDPRC